MEGKRTIEKIRLRNILSFGDKGEEIELMPLNVLIGQNASGKSNFIDVFKLLKSLPQEKGLVKFVSGSGGIIEWIWKGFHLDDIFEIEIEISRMKHQFSYELKVVYILDKYHIYEETLAELNTDSEPVRTGSSKIKEVIKYQENIHPDNTMFSPNFSDREVSRRLFSYHVMQSTFFSQKIYTDLQTTRKSEMRKPQLPDAINDFLEEDGSNLSLVLNDLEHRGDTKDKIVSYLKKFNPRIKDYSIRILGGTVQLFVREEGLEKPISAMRLSDGTLRYLCLLAILCHPEPPPLICIEEPEVGLHPDILPTIAELLIDASQRTQLIVTTHSDILVSALSDVPEAVLVCEADEDGTHFKRLDKENLKEWLEEYSLGELWLKGEIGGTRW
jgi:predicted ATPase